MIDRWLELQMHRYRQECEAIHYARVMALQYDPKLMALRTLKRRKKQSASKRMSTLYTLLTND